MDPQAPHACAACVLANQRNTPLLVNSEQVIVGHRYTTSHWSLVIGRMSQHESSQHCINHSSSLCIIIIIIIIRIIHNIDSQQQQSTVNSFKSNHEMSRVNSSVQSSTGLAWFAIDVADRLLLHWVPVMNSESSINRSTNRWFNGSMVQWSSSLSLLSLLIYWLATSHWVIIEHCTLHDCTTDDSDSDPQARLRWFHGTVSRYLGGWVPVEKSSKAKAFGAMQW